ncbi:MAG TPA: DUF1579 family protein [Terracidiphilus sp.]|nr:DUF1579 family protein [Terracidiphilus sp.]
MKFPVGAVLAVSGVFALAQQQPMQPADALQKLSFLQGDWSGKQAFNTDGGPAMVGDATDRIELGIAGKYFCEMLSTTLPNRKPTDTRHFISYDRQTGKYTAWWFNDTSYHPTELTGDYDGSKLVLMSAASAPGPVLRATYESTTADKLTFQLEMKNGDDWTSLFLTTYSKKAGAQKP